MFMCKLVVILTNIYCSIEGLDTFLSIGSSSINFYLASFIDFILLSLLVDTTSFGLDVTLILVIIFHIFRLGTHIQTWHPYPSLHPLGLLYIAYVSTTTTKVVINKQYFAFLLLLLLYLAIFASYPVQPHCIDFLCLWVHFGPIITHPHEQKRSI